MNRIPANERRCPPGCPDPDWCRGNRSCYWDCEGLTTRCDICGGPTSFIHDHRADQSGLDDGPPLREPRKRPMPKPVEQVREIRARAWETRREKYGQYGHR